MDHASGGLEQRAVLQLECCKVCLPTLAIEKVEQARTTLLTMFACMRSRGLARRYLLQVLDSHQEHAIKQSACGQSKWPRHWSRRTHRLAEFGRILGLTGVGMMAGGNRMCHGKRMIPAGPSQAFVAAGKVRECSRWVVWGNTLRGSGHG